MAPKPRIIKELRGAGRVYDWRDTGLLPANGKRIRLHLMVEHIPVVPNQAGTGDFIQLANVLRAQNLGLQAATDREGHVALYTRLDELCWQAKGANQVSCGVEHMHMSISESWSKKQLRASAWLWQYAEHVHGIPMQTGKLGRGPGFVKVVRRGHVSHQAVSAAAGFNDRSDPGPGYDWAYVLRAAKFYAAHGGFTRRTANGWVGV